MLSLFSVGKTTGVVLDSGHGATYSVPVFEGYALPFASQKLPLSGEMITQNLIKMIKEENNFNLEENQETSLFQNIKEQSCFIAYNFDS